MRGLFATIAWFGAVVGIAAVDTGAVAQAPAESDAKESLRDYVVRVQRRQAHGVYLAGKKIGWLTEELRLGKHEGREVAENVSEGKFVVHFLGAKSEMEMHSRTVYDLGGDGEILAASETTVEDGSKTEIVVTRDGNELVITTKTGGDRIQRRVPLAKDTLGLLQRMDLWLESGPKQGDTFHNYSSSWDEADVNVEELHTYQGSKTILWGGVATKAHLVSLNIHGAQVEATIGTGGQIWEGMLGGVMKIRAEKEAAAKRLDGAAVDMLAASAIRIDTPLGDPEDVRSLTLRISGLQDFTVPTSHRQRIVQTDDGEVHLMLRADHRTGKSEPIGAEERKKWLRSTPMFPADHERIRVTTRKILGDESDPLKVARKLTKWMTKNLRKTYAENASNALQVLENRAGDCSEHATLFVTLARAAGIPAREVGGVAYVGDNERLFGWHAWAEIHDGEQWITVDPMWQQIYVDATHIKLSESADDWSWINVVGRLKLDVVRFSTDE